MFEKYLYGVCDFPLNSEAIMIVILVIMLYFLQLHMVNI